MRIPIGYPAPIDEKGILELLRREHPIYLLQQVASQEDLLRLIPSVWEVQVDETLQSYIVALTGATRQHPDMALGASPRGSLALFRASQALAAVRGRDFVIPDDIKLLAPVILTHRLLLRPEAELRGRSTKSVLNDVLENIPLDLGKIAP